VTGRPARRAFEAARPFPLDPFQRQALDSLDAGRSVLVAAPTGAGKTLVAEYAVSLALAEGTKAFYTTPLKALSNQKHSDLGREHGPDRVGLLTGDTAVNPGAPAVVMTTEVLRNMIYAGSDLLDGLRYVVLDEVHFLQDRYRGAVWEEVIIHLPPSVRLVCLSATVSNAEEVADWIQAVRGGTDVVIEEHRPVELRHRYLVGERSRDRVHLLPTFAGDTGDPAGTPGGAARPNPEVARLEAQARVRTSRGAQVRRGRPDPRRGRSGRPRGSPALFTPGRVAVVERLDAEHLLPAIVFVFSRAGCDQAVSQVVAAHLRLTDGGERRALREIAARHTAGLSASDLAVLGFDPWVTGLEAGVGAHHAGLVPPMKEAVEEAFATGLLKVVFATETLSLGINMPARSVVIEKLSKFTGERHETLTPGEYTQLTGRAGRRGIDRIGYAVVCHSPWVPFEQVAGLASRRTYELTSSFRPTYNMAVNLVRRWPEDEAHRLLSLSFAQFRADRDVVSLERRRERTRERAERRWAEAGRDAGDDLDGYRALLAAAEGDRRARGGGRPQGAGLLRLQPGDVLVTGRRGRLVVVGHARSRDHRVRLLVLDRGGRLVRMGPDDLERNPMAAGRIELPRHHAPRSAEFRRAAAAALREARVAAPGRGAARETGAPPRVAPHDAADALARHPLHRDPRRDLRLRAASEAERLDRDAARLNERVGTRSTSLARQLDRVRLVLSAWGYVDGWSLTPVGELLTRIYHEADLLVAETLRRGVLDGLDPSDLAALVSCFTYERRGPDDAPVPPVWPSSAVAARYREVERAWRDLVGQERDTGLPETRAPDPGFAIYAAEWVAGDPLDEVLADGEVTGGDFVRQVRQCIDLLGQIADGAPDPATAFAAREAARLARRGVVVGSPVVALADRAGEVEPGEASPEVDEAARPDERVGG